MIFRCGLRITSHCSHSWCWRQYILKTFEAYNCELVSRILIILLDGSGLWMEGEMWFWEHSRRSVADIQAYSTGLYIRRVDYDIKESKTSIGGSPWGWNCYIWCTKTSLKYNLKKCKTRTLFASSGQRSAIFKIRNMITNSLLI